MIRALPARVQVNAEDRTARIDIDRSVGAPETAARSPFGVGWAAYLEAASDGDDAR